MSAQFLEELKEAAGSGAVRTKEPMKEHTTFRVGGPADYFVLPDSIEAVKRISSLCQRESKELLIIGNGSNLLVGDKGFRGVVLCFGKAFSGCRREENSLRARAGILLSRLSKEAMEAGLSGLEFASGIPGTLGGALYMNAGAYGGEMRQVVKEATWLLPDKTVETVKGEALGLGYRSSRAQENGAVFLEALISLKPGSQEEIRAQMEELNRRRREKQPLEYPSAGSTFKRPEGYFAGKLIQDAGLSGLRIGGASVSEKHCGFVVNDQNGTAEDIRRLCSLVQKRVKEAFGVWLELEVRMVGEF